MRVHRVGGKMIAVDQRHLSARSHVSSTGQLEKALVATGFPYDRSNVQELVDRVAIIIKYCADLRRNGAASLDLCSVANGTLDAYIETIMPWDLAAGLVIALEAGAKYPNPGAKSQLARVSGCQELGYCGTWRIRRPVREA